MKRFRINELMIVRILFGMLITAILMIIPISIWPEFFGVEEPDCEKIDCSCIGPPNDRNCDGITDWKQ